MPDPDSESSVEAWALTVPASHEDEVSGLVWILGCTGITIEKVPGESVRLVCFFSDPDLPEQEMGDLAVRFGSTASRVSVPNPDWVRRFKETFTAFEASPFRVVPEWAPPPPPVAGAPGSEDTASRERLSIRVDPGRAFGTGTHESTKLCLRTLGSVAAHLPPAPRTLDIGCGTGILAIAAVKLVNARVVACDHDPLAGASAIRHAVLNDVPVSVLLMDGCRGLVPARFDLVFANLMAPLLIARAGEISAMGSPGCRFVLAGLLRDEEPAVRGAWPTEWRVASSYQGEWASLLYEQP